MFVADGLTSLSKFLQDMAVAVLLLVLSVRGLDDLKDAYITKMKHSPLPYLAASMPYM